MLRSLQLHSLGGSTETRGLDVFLKVKLRRGRAGPGTKATGQGPFLYTRYPSKPFSVAALAGVMISFVGEVEPLFCAMRIFL